MQRVFRALLLVSILCSFSAASMLPLQECRQSSTHTPCRRAIDNNLNQHWPGKSCSHTKMQKGPWWQASTNRLAHIRQVRIYARLCGPVCSRYLKDLIIKVDGHVCARYTSTKGYLSTHTFECNRVGQVVEIRSRAKTYLMLCEVQVFGNYASLAHKGRLLPLQDCRQSSTHTPCRRAIDNNFSQYWSGKSCAHTKRQKNPWWQANTNRLAHIQQVRIYTRLCTPPCRVNFRHIVVKVDGHICARHKGVGLGSTITLSCNRVGQVVEIQAMAKRTYLMLCEVQVFGTYASLAHKGVRLPLQACRQSSTHTPCHRAIDGNTNQKWSGNSCSHTNMQNKPWWQANTPRLAHFHTVRIYNRLCGPGCSSHQNNIVIKVDGVPCASYHSSHYFSVKTFHCNRVGQILEIHSTVRSYLMLCEVQAFGKWASLAHTGPLLPLKHCSQSSTHTPCARAIDGKLAQHFTAKSCSHTKMQTKPWWQAKTIKPAFIQQVRIYARLCGPVCSRYLKNIIVKVDGRVCASYHSTAGYLSTRTFNCNRYGSTVRIESTAKTYLMLCEVQVFGRYGRKPPTHIEPGTGEETGTHETGTTGESGSPSGHGETGEVVSFERHCIDGHDSSEHKLGTSWTTKVPAEGYCYHYSCTEKSEAGPVSVDCMDASGHCVKPSSEGTDFACRSGYTSCSCVHRDGRTGIIFS
uniref:FTP domain-containing protein n=1 Tax=Macrostomum lignano TaxID=282301 RepID=A0A1I8H1H2_9PLAT